MRKLLVVLLVLVCAIPAFAQLAPGSLENFLTADLFKNEIDQNFEANTDFGTFGKTFFFAGLGNPLYSQAFSTVSGRFDVGIYVPKSVPLSIYGDLQFTAFENRRMLGNYTSVNYSGTPSNVTEGTIVYNIDWIADQTRHTYTHPMLAKDWTAQVQGLTKIGGIVVGLIFSMNQDNADYDSLSDTDLLDDLAAAEYFQNTVYTEFYNPSAPTVRPAPVADYTVTTRLSNIDTADFPVAGDSGANTFGNTISFGVPLAIKTGNMSHFIGIGMTFDWKDRSASYEQVQSLHSQVVGGASVPDYDVNITSKQAGTALNLGYGLNMPVKGSAGNAVKVNLGAFVNLNTASYSYDYLDHRYNLSVLNNKTGVAGGVHDVWTSTYTPTVDFGVDLTGARVFDIPLGSAIAFRFAPTLGLGVSTDQGLVEGDRTDGAFRASTVTYTQDLDANFAYDNTPYTRTTTNYSGTAGSTLTFDGTVSLPMAIKFKPAGWLFSLMLGVDPSLQVVSTSTIPSAIASEEISENMTGTNVTGTTYNYTYALPSAVSTDVTYNIQEAHRLGVSLSLDNGVRLDAMMGASLLDFNNFYIQAFVPF